MGNVLLGRFCKKTPKKPDRASFVSYFFLSLSFSFLLDKPPSHFTDWPIFVQQEANQLLNMDSLSNQFGASISSTCNF
jgi:hypothetical protein